MTHRRPMSAPEAMFGMAPIAAQWTSPHGPNTIRANLHPKSPVKMADERAKRRLAAIAVADVVGYSRLMETDEAGTLAVLKERRKTILEPMVRGHEGRIVKVMGDGVLMEFASAVNAVKAALELQEKMAKANAPLSEDRTHRSAHRHQSWRHHRRGIGRLWRRRQHSRAAGGAGGTGRHLRFGQGARRSARQGRSCLRGHGRGRAQEHRQSGACVQDRRMVQAGSGRTLAVPSGQTFDCRPAVHQHERRSRTAVFLRRHHRGHHHRTVALPFAVRHCPEFVISISRQGRRRPPDRARPRRALRRRRQRPQDGQPDSHHGPADRRRSGQSSVERALRPRHRGAFRGSGRADADHRRHRGGPAGGRRNQDGLEQADRQPAGL